MLTFTKHPILDAKAPTDEEIVALATGSQEDKEILKQWHKQHEARVQLAEEDPIRHGFELEHWKYAEELLGQGRDVMCLGGNRSGKTEFGARAVVKAAIENPNATIICFAQDENASIEVQQSAVYRNLPPEYKKKSKTETEYVNYKVKTGFSGASLILGNGSKILFRKYSQFIANRSAFEGYELGAKNPNWHNIGVWLDEYLEDGDLVETMRFRLATRGAQMLLTFTPIDGYTPFVASYLKDVETKRTAAAELLGGEQVPLIQVNNKIDCGIVFFHSILNPFGGYKDIAN